MVEKLKVKDINGMNKPKFMSTFGNIVEKHPEAALFLVMQRPYMTAYDVFSALEKFFDSLTIGDKLKILLQHPELATNNKYITEESLEEQTNAGLRTLSEEDGSSFINYNSQYRKKFGFPFIMCVHGNDSKKILQTLKEHLEEDVETEINRGIIEVKKISKLRLNSLIAD